MTLDELAILLDNMRQTIAQNGNARIPVPGSGRIGIYLALFCFTLLAGFFTPGSVQAASTVPPDPTDTPMLTNPNFECSEGTYALAAPQGGEMHIHTGWTVDFLAGTPWLNSASMQYNDGSCGGDAHVEKIEGNDSLAIFAHDLEWTAEPGKPFDVAVHQQVEVIPDTAYSLSAWLLSLCGGSTMPNDCPEGYYMAKMIGIDPTGGTDPLADTVIWAENRQNFVENGERVGWTNLQVSALAESETITVFGRINSPFQWHGNHAFIDAFSLVEAPQAHFTVEAGEVDDNKVELQWAGTQSAQIDAIPNGRYQLLFDVEYRVSQTGPWVRWQSRQSATSALFTAKAANVPHYFRVLARAEQPPDGPAGAWPNHRYPGTWSDSLALTFRQEPPEKQKVFIPIVQR